MTATTITNNAIVVVKPPTLFGLGSSSTGRVGAVSTRSVGRITGSLDGKVNNARNSWSCNNAFEPLFHCVVNSSRDVMLGLNASQPKRMERLIWVFVRSVEVEEGWGMGWRETCKEGFSSLRTLAKIRDADWVITLTTEVRSRSLVDGWVVPASASLTCLYRRSPSL